MCPGCNQRVHALCKEGAKCFRCVCRVCDSPPGDVMRPCKSSMHRVHDACAIAVPDRIEWVCKTCIPKPRFCWPISGFFLYFQGGRGAVASGLSIQQRRPPLLLTNGGCSRPHHGYGAPSAAKPALQQMGFTRFHLGERESQFLLHIVSCTRCAQCPQHVRVVHPLCTTTLSHMHMCTVPTTGKQEYCDSSLSVGKRRASPFVTAMHPVLLWPESGRSSPFLSAHHTPSTPSLADTQQQAAAGDGSCTSESGAAGRDGSSQAHHRQALGVCTHAFRRRRQRMHAAAPPMQKAVGRTTTSGRIHDNLSNTGPATPETAEGVEPWELRGGGGVSTRPRYGGGGGGVRSLEWRDLENVTPILEYHRKILVQNSAIVAQQA